MYFIVFMSYLTCNLQQLPLHAIPKLCNIGKFKGSIKALPKLLKGKRGNEAFYMGLSFTIMTYFDFFSKKKKYKYTMSNN